MSCFTVSTTTRRGDARVSHGEATDAPASTGESPGYPAIRALAFTPDHR
jgi:hypothetical protein